MVNYLMPKGEETQTIIDVVKNNTALPFLGQLNHHLILFLFLFFLSVKHRERNKSRTFSPIEQEKFISYGRFNFQCITLAASTHRSQDTGRLFLALSKRLHPHRGRE